jgi:hypothetical protein
MYLPEDRRGDQQISRTPRKGTSMIDQKFHQLFGPQHPGYYGRQGPSWQHPETANSSSIKPFYFHGVWPPPWWCTWTVIWQPAANGTSKTRLVAMDVDGPGYGHWQTLVQFDGPPNMGPIVSAVDMTAVFANLIGNRVSKYIGMQMWDDGLVPYTLWEGRLETDLIIPDATAARQAAKVAQRAPLASFVAQPGPVVHVEARDFISRLAALPRPPAQVT